MTNPTWNNGITLVPFEVKLKSIDELLNILAPSKNEKYRVFIENEYGTFFNKTGIVVGIRQMINYEYTFLVIFPLVKTMWIPENYLIPIRVCSGR